MRVVVFTNTYKPTVSGVVTSIALFRRGLEEAGHEMHIITPEYEDYQDEEPYIYRVPAVDLPAPLDFSLAWPFKSLVAPIVRGIRPALIHSQHPVLMGGLAADLAEEMGLPLVFTFHCRYDEYAERLVPLIPELAGLVIDEIIGRYLERCTHVIAPSPSVRDLLVNEYEVDAPVSVVPTPVDLSGYHDLQPGRVRAALGLADAEVLLYVGRLSEEKSLHFLLEVFARVAQARSQARLLLVGRGPKEGSLARTARRMGLGERVIFGGAVPHREVPHYAAAADLFVFASEVETQGLALIEAMAAGTPVVAVRSPGTTDTLSAGGGVLVPADDEAFAAAVMALLADRQRRQALGEQALQAAQGYAMPTVTARLVSVYEQAVAAGPRAGR